MNNKPIPLARVGTSRDGIETQHMKLNEFEATSGKPEMDYEPCFVALLVDRRLIEEMTITAMCPNSPKESGDKGNTATLTYQLPGAGVLPRIEPANQSSIRHHLYRYTELILSSSLIIIILFSLICSPITLY